jgi:hypothetical protein
LEGVPHWNAFHLPSFCFLFIPHHITSAFDIRLFIVSALIYLATFQAGSWVEQPNLGTITHL